MTHEPGGTPARWFTRRVRGPDAATYDPAVSACG